MSVRWVRGERDGRQTLLGLTAREWAVVGGLFGVSLIAGNPVEWSVGGLLGRAGGAYLVVSAFVLLRKRMGAEG